MPAKNSPGKFGKKFRLLNASFHRKFMKDTGIQIPYALFAKIIQTNTQNIADSVVNETEGVQLPENFGQIVVTKYKPHKMSRRKRADHLNSKKFKKFVPMLNLHTFGYIFYIRWFKIGARIQNIKYFHLYRARPLKRAVSKSIMAGTQFFQWSPSDLWSLTKMERKFNKKYKTED